MDDYDPNTDDIDSHKRVNLFVRHAKKGVFFTSDAVEESIVKAIRDYIPD